MAGEEARRVSGMIAPEVEPGMYQIAPRMLIGKEALKESVQRFLDKGGYIDNITGKGREADEALVGLIVSHQRRSGKGPPTFTDKDAPWEPVEDLEIRALDSRCEPMIDEPSDDPQRYGSTVIGFDLMDPEGCRSIVDVTTGEGRQADEALARLIVAGLQLLYSTTDPRTVTGENRPEGCPGDCRNHHDLCVGDEEEQLV